MMPARCASDDCRLPDTPDIRAKGISFHSFPKDPEQFEQWVKAIGGPDKFTVGRGLPRLCSRHFLKADYERGPANRVKLRPGALPIMKVSKAETMSLTASSSSSPAPAKKPTPKPTAARTPGSGYSAARKNPKVIGKMIANGIKKEPAGPRRSKLVVRLVIWCRMSIRMRWIYLRNSGKFKSDEEFADHLLRSEEQRQDRSLEISDDNLDYLDEDDGGEEDAEDEYIEEDSPYAMIQSSDSEDDGRDATYNDDELMMPVSPPPSGMPVSAASASATEDEDDYHEPDFPPPKPVDFSLPELDDALLVDNEIVEDLSTGKIEFAADDSVSITFHPTDPNPTEAIKKGRSYSYQWTIQRTKPLPDVPVKTEAEGIKPDEMAMKSEMVETPIPEPPAIEEDPVMQQLMLAKLANRISIRCVLCNELVSSLTLYLAHLMTHAAKWPFTCRVCRGRFTTQQYLDTHVALAHSPEHPLACDLCCTTFDSQASLDVHFKHHFSGWRFLCEMCGQAFRLRSTFLEHINKHVMPVSVDPSTLLFTCTVCGMPFSKWRMLTNHLSTHLRKKDDFYKCDICSRRFRLESSLQQHSLVHSSYLYSCSLCNEKFSSYKMLYNHRLRQHATTDLWTCPECHVKLLSEPALLRHLDRHQTSQIAKAEKGNIIHRTFQMYHRQTHIGLPARCDVCSEEQKSRHALQYHAKRRHPGYKPFPCPRSRCGRHFHSWLKLRAHQLCHRETDILCHLCARKFHYQASLNAHMLTHVPRKLRHTCRVCDKSFNHLSTLRRHEFVHAGAKPYSCEYCGRTFRERKKYKDHRLLHMGNFCHICSNCNTAFMQKSSLEEHKQTCLATPTETAELIDTSETALTVEDDPTVVSIPEGATTIGEFTEGTVADLEGEAMVAAIEGLEGAEQLLMVNEGGEPVDLGNNTVSFLHPDGYIVCAQLDPDQPEGMITQLAMPTLYHMN